MFRRLWSAWYHVYLFYGLLLYSYLHWGGEIYFHLQNLFLCISGTNYRRFFFGVSLWYVLGSDVSTNYHCFRRFIYLQDFTAKCLLMYVPIYILPNVIKCKLLVIMSKWQSKQRGSEASPYSNGYFAWIVRVLWLKYISPYVLAYLYPTEFHYKITTLIKKRWS